MVEVPDDGSISAALEASLRNAKEIRRRHSATIAAARALARVLDESVELASEGVRIDNTLFPTFLKYCDALGLTLGGKAPVRKLPAEKKPESKMMKYQGLKVV